MGSALPPPACVSACVSEKAALTSQRANGVGGQNLYFSGMGTYPYSKRFEEAGRMELGEENPPLGGRCPVRAGQAASLIRANGNRPEGADESSCV